MQREYGAICRIIYLMRGNLRRDDEEILMYFKEERCKVTENNRRRRFGFDSPRINKEKR